MADQLAAGTGFDAPAKGSTAPAPTASAPQKKNAKGSAASAKLELKTPKGTRDWGGEGIILREQIFNTS